MNFKTVLLLLFILSFKSIHAQKFTNAPSYRNIAGEAYFRLNFDNDYFAGSDDNYTQGISIEFVNSLFEKNPVNLLFPKNHGFEQYGLTLEHATFTPNVISSKDIQYGFRPFAATLYLKFFKTDSNITKQSRLYSSLTAGVIGPLAYGEEGQSYIHEVTDNWIPYGWRNQVKNDFLINYELKHEYRLLDLGNLFYLNSDAGLRVGSMFTDLSAGLTGIFGLYNSILNTTSRNSNFQLYVYNNPRVYLVGYDATLQGGLFSNSPYIINSNEIQRLKVQMDYGIVLTTKHFYLEYSLSLITKEFDTGATEGWGGFKLGFRI